MFTIAIAGELPDNGALFRQADELLGQIKGYLSPQSGEIQLRFALSPPYTGGAWREWLGRSGCPVSGYLNASCDNGEDRFDHYIRVNSPLRDTLGELLCDRNDLLIVVWNEDVNELDGATWELMRIALRKRMPWLWISSKTGRIYWPDKTSYEPYRPEQLRELCEITTQAEKESDPCEIKDFPLLFIGRRFYKRYLRRYKASAKTVDAKEDLILRDDYELTGQFAAAESSRRILLQQYHHYDNTAIEMGDRYHSALYWRSVLPMITTLIVAVGFYGTSVIAAIPIFSLRTWGIIAGFGFLFHGLLNLYVFLLSKSKRVKAYQEEMLRNRRMAEMLRVLIHFVPFGISPDLRKLCGGDRRLYASLRRIVLQAEPDSMEITRENSVEMFLHIDEMLSDQIAYHTLSRDRFSRLVNHLDRWSRAVFYIGFCVVILRAGLQFLMSIPDFPLPQLQLGNDLSAKGFISSFANMAALLSPTWYSYFATKLSLCNFRFNRDNHQMMMDLLAEEQRNADLLRETIDDVPAEAFSAIGENLAEIMLVTDNSVWTAQYRNTRITHL